jgi:HKD family nuclease
VPQISFIHPLDQPLKKKRLVEELRQALKRAEFDSLSIAVAAVTLGTLLRLDSDLKSWKANGKKIVAVYGVDIAATTLEALAYSMANFDEVYISRISGVKFHPKMYIFSGLTRGLLFFGSNNMTVPGTETNLETCVRIEYELPTEAAAFAEAVAGWNALMTERASNTVFALNNATLQILVDEGRVTSEKNRVASGESGTASGSALPASALPQSTLKKSPPSPLPAAKFVPPPGTPSTMTAPAAAAAAAMTPATPAGPVGTPGHTPPSPAAAAPSAAPAEIPAAAAVAAAAVAATSATTSADTLVIQIKPHHNGEIFLSKLAVDENPAFFGFPFTGWTTPKKVTNPQYPQRIPDPIANIVVYGAGAVPVLVLSYRALNTVFYKTKTEIRITCSELVPVVPDYSIMVMRLADPGATTDYEIEIYRPDSPSYALWLAACNQTMPGGGKQPRKFGWL